MTVKIDAPSTIVSQLPDSAPAVSMDRRLGARLKPDQVIDFNYDAFMTGARELGATDDEIANLNVEVRDSRPRTPLERLQKFFGHAAIGAYYPAQNRIEAVYDPDSPKETDNTVFHEVGHYLEDLQGHLYEETDQTREHSANNSKRFKRDMALGSAAMVATAALTGDLQTGLLVGMTSTLASVADVARFSYKHDPAETRAQVHGQGQQQRGVVTVTQM